jgi:hypothetical protein
MSSRAPSPSPRPRAGRPGVGREITPGRDQRRGADRHIDQEDGPPAEAGHVRRDEQATEHLAGHGAAGEGHRIAGDGGRPCLAGEAQLDSGERLREHHCPAGALEYPRGDQHGRVGRQPAGQRRQREQGDPGQEGPPVAVRLPDPGTGDQQHRERDQVAADHQLHLPARGMQAVVNRWRGHVGDRHIHLGHERRDEQDSEQPVVVSHA